MRKRCYRAVSIKNVNVNELVDRLSAGRVQVGVDVAKKELVVVVMDSEGGFERPWKVKQPSELGELVTCLLGLSQQRELVVAMESTGTYGDSLRQALMDAGLVPHRVNAKSVKDYSETFDGVPSNHDGKDAAIIAELTRLGKAQPWPTGLESEWEANVERHVQWLDTQQDILMLWLGRMEALLARHWPELSSLLKLNSSTLLQMLAHYGSPAEVAQSEEDAQQRLRKWGGAWLSDAKIEAVLKSARGTVGVRMAEPTVQTLRDVAGQALRARQEVHRAKQALKVLATENADLQGMTEVVGAATACVLWITVGNPHHFHCGEAYRKAMGLNLRERSSGQYRGKLKITKRGSAMARRWLYFAALRIIQQSAVKDWYLRKKHKDQGRGGRAVISVMRKLALAIYAVTTRQEAFDLERLLPGRSSRPGQGQAKIPGGSPPDPKDLRMDVKSKGEERPGTNPERAPSLSTPGMALGSVPTVALSSTQVNNQ